MEITIPIKARASRDKIEGLTPEDAFYTAGYGLVPGLGPTMVYKFNGKDFNLKYNVLVMAGNPFTDFKTMANRINSEETVSVPYSQKIIRDEKGNIDIETLTRDEFVSYKLERLPPYIEKKIIKKLKLS